MEQKINIPLKGTSHLDNAENGSMALMINVRPERGVLKAVGKKTSLLDGEISLSAAGYNKVFLHKNAEYTHWIGIDDDKKLVWFDPKTAVAIQEIATITYTDINSVLVRSMKGFLCLITDTRQYVYLYNSNTISYISVSATPPILNVEAIEGDIQVFKSDTTTTSIGTSISDDEAATMGAKIMNEIFINQQKASSEGYNPGYVWLRIGLRMFDNTVIFHSEPIFCTSPAHLSFVTPKGDTDNPYYTINQLASKMQLRIDASSVAAIEASGGLYTGIVVYASEPVSGYEITKENITATDFDTVFAHYYAYFFPLSDSFKTLNDAKVWYKLQYFPVEEIKSITPVDDRVTLYITDIKNYYTNFAAREPLRVDSGSWHTLRAGAMLVYNSRLMLADIVTTLSDGFAFSQVDSVYYNLIVNGSAPADVVFRFTNSESYSGKQITYLKTDEGDKVVIKDITIPALKQFSFDGTNYSELTNEHRLLPLPGQVAYPDARAYKTIFLIKDSTGNQYRTLVELALKSSQYHNFSQYVHVSYLESIDTENPTATPTRTKHFFWQDIEADITAGVWSLPAATVPESNSLLTDQNRVIASELNNPLYFPADTSYRIGNGKVMAMAVNTESLSQGQFGQYPVVVFTTEGIFAMMQGNYPVLFQAVSPLNGESCISRNTLPVHNAIVFFSNKGVTMLSGANAVTISEILNGEANNPVRESSIYDECTDNNYLFNSQAVIDEVSDIREEFSGYLSAQTLLAFDKKRNELILFTPGLAYSLHYSFASQVWFRCSQNYREAVNAWPDSFLIDSNDNILDASSESQTDAVDILLQSNPVKMEGNFGINDLIFDCDITPDTGKSVGIYLYGAEQDDHYFILGGSQVNKRVRDYRSNTFSRMKVSDIIFMLTAKAAPADIFIKPLISFVNKPKYNQIKS